MIENYTYYSIFEYNYQIILFWRYICFFLKVLSSVKLLIAFDRSKGEGEKKIAVVVSKVQSEVKSNQALSKTNVQAKPKEARTVFNIQPPTGDLASAAKSDTPSAQDIKDGHAYLRPMPKFLYQVRALLAYCLFKLKFITSQCVTAVLEKLIGLLC